MVFLGVAILITGAFLNILKTMHFNKGDLIILISIVIWGLYAILSSKIMRHCSAISTKTFSTFIGVVILVIPAVWELRNFSINLDINLLWL